MDQLDQMRLLMRVVECQNFRIAAADLRIPRSTATTAIQALEAAVGAQLLRRTTRTVVATAEGEAFVKRCRTILADIDDAFAETGGATMRGPIRVDMNGPMARSFILPELPSFLARYPDITIFIGEGDRFVDLVREGFDCVIRAGENSDSDLIVRRLGSAREATFASPGYLGERGMPRSPGDLDGHDMVGFVSSRTRQVLPLEFTVEGKLITRMLPTRVCVSNADNYAALARLGFGLIQAPRYRYEDDLTSGHLVEVLPEFPPSPLPISILYPANRQLAARVRLFIDWVIEVVAVRL